MYCLWVEAVAPCPPDFGFGSVSMMGLVAQAVVSVSEASILEEGLALEGF